MGGAEQAKDSLPSVPERDSRVYEERLNGILTYSIATMALISAYWILAAEWVRGTNYFVFSLNIGVAQWMRRSPRFSSWASSFYIGSLLLMLVLDALLTGMNEAPVLWVLPIIPMMGAHLRGSKHIWFWAICASLGVVFVYGVSRSGWEPPPVTVSKGESLFVLLSTGYGYARIGYAALLSKEKSMERSKQEASELIQSRFAADRASAAKSAFLANMSEQIKIPLQGAVDDSKALLKESIKVDRASSLALDESVRRVSRIVNDIVDISRMETGVFLPDSSILDLGALFDSLALETSALATKRGIEMSWSVAKAPFRVVGDSGRLLRLTNILAREAIASAQAQVEFHVEMQVLESTQENPEHVEVQILVSRDGELQQSERSNLVFGMRVQENERNVDVETGLGMAMAESICQFMGGGLEFRGENDKGLSVTVARVYLAKDPAYLVSSEDQSRCA